MSATSEHRGIRLTLCEIDDLCYRHCELEEELTAEEIDRLIDTAATAHALAEAGAEGRLNWYRDAYRELRADRDAAVREREQAREALRYYADPASWRQLETMGTASANLDRGSRARAALTGEGTE